MNTNLLHIDIVDDESLLRACDVLHDAYCDISSLQYDEKAGSVRVLFEREYFEDSQLLKYEPRLLMWKVSFPMAKSELSLEGIKTFIIEDKSKIQIYSFNECQVKNNVFKLFFNENMEIAITFEDKPKGLLLDKDILDKMGSFYQWRNPLKKEMPTNQ
jgi:hypothetical protein